MSTLIKFDSKYLDWIKQGRKTTTIRRGLKNYTLGSAFLQDQVFKLPATICALELTSYELLTKDNAHEEGFSSLLDLQMALKTIYPDLKDNEDLTLVRFQVSGVTNVSV